MLSNEEHNELLSKQFLLEIFRRDHPCSHMLEAIPPPTRIKRTFLKYSNEIQHISDQTSNATNFIQTLKTIHCGSV